MSNPLEGFSPAARAWFTETFGQPTPPQTAGWPVIQAGEHTLILAPTGSGKTLAAFLWGIDRIFQQTSTDGRPPTAESVAPADGRGQRSVGGPARGVQLVYVSPLKALNNDIERNLRAPLAGIRATAERMGIALPPLRVAVRTGDTPGHARAAMLREPPHILITTPESLYLMLTSPRAREMFRATRTVIVDEIHTLVGEKRGAHLALSLERLERIAGARVQRIGLSATICPLEEAARFLGGQESGVTVSPCHPVTPSPRPVTIVDTGYRKPLELRVVTPVEDFRNLPADTIWPAVIPAVLGDVLRHHSTLIFCNNRRLAERTADRLNAQITAERSEEIPPGSTEALAPGGIARDRGIFALGAEGPIRAHHGSMDKQARRQMEEDLKAGRLPALVGTSSLELGIDIGAVDLVVQLQSPKSISQGLQRVGRSGHMVGQTSRGRIYATFREDVLEAAAVARGMLEGDVEPVATPQNPLDVLAQQIVAMVAVETWSVPALFDLARQAYPYRNLTLEAFHGVLDMLAGKYQALGGPTHASLRARVAWDRVNDRVAALPGSRLLALMNPGVIPDTGAYDVYLADGKTRVGQLDEEFVFETRVGDNFLLGSNIWRVLEMRDDRVIVGDAAGAVPRMPFWRGDYPWRPWELGLRIGRLRGEIGRRVADENRKSKTEAGESPAGLPSTIAWLQREYALDANSAHNLVGYVQRQLDAVGVVASDKTIVVETFQDAVGDGRMVVHSSFGGRVNGAWALALSSALRERYGVGIEAQANDDGILLRFPQTIGAAAGDPRQGVDVVANMTAQEARERILAELPQSALFGAHFRMNAARALLLPRSHGHKRTPFWLQRLKAKDLLGLVQRYGDFPIVAETYRDCLRDVLDLPHLEEVLTGIENAEIQVVPIATLAPSPIAAGLLYNFISVYMYEWDAPKAERQLQTLVWQADYLDDLLAPAVGRPSAAVTVGTGAPAASAEDRAATAPDLTTLLEPEAIAETLAQVQHLPPFAARSADELAVILAELGDLDTDEVAARCTGDAHAWLADLAAQGRISELEMPTASGPARRWVGAELAEEYRSAFLAPRFSLPILHRYLRAAGPVARPEILARYAFDGERLDAALAQLMAERQIVSGRFTAPGDNLGGAAAGDQAAAAAMPAAGAIQYCDRDLLARIRRRTIALLRCAVQPVPLATYADFLARWTSGSSLRGVMAQLAGVALPGPVWARDVLPGRLPDFHGDDLAALCEAGELVWVTAGRDPRRGHVRFFGRGQGGLYLGPPEEGGLSELAQAAYAFLRSEGASFMADLQAGLGMKPADVQAALVELALAGLATNDTLDALHAILAFQPAPLADKTPFSSLEADLAGRLPPRPLTRNRYRTAKQEAARRVERMTAANELWPGRWSLVYRVAVLGPPLSDAARSEAQARALLARYGVVAREVMDRETGPFDWALIYAQFQRMELRGELRRGYFVAGLSGVQYALPEAVERLRAAGEEDTPIVLNATDPANLYGGEGLGDAPAFARLPSTHVVLVAGRPILIAQDGGERVIAAASATEEELRRALQTYLARPAAPRRMFVAEWNGAPALDGPAEALLRGLGFHRTPAGLERWEAR